jgi:hypothetical protein
MRVMPADDCPISRRSWVGERRGSGSGAQHAEHGELGVVEPELGSASRCSASQPSESAEMRPNDRERRRVDAEDPLPRARVRIEERASCSAGRCGRSTVPAPNTCSRSDGIGNASGGWSAPPFTAIERPVHPRRRRRSE